MSSPNIMYRFNHRFPFPRESYRCKSSKFSLSRRQFLHLTSLFSTSLGMTLAMGGCENSPRVKNYYQSTTDDPPVRVGYLPITDAAPLLVAYDQGFYQAEGLEAEHPQKYHSWDAIVQAFMKREVNVIHVLMPTSIWIRYGYQFPGKIVAWNHTNGSALTVLPEIDKPEDLGGRKIAVPSWYSIHNVIVQMLLRQHGLNIITQPGNTSLPVGDDEVHLVVLPPREMLSTLSAGEIAGYIVAEPYNSAAEEGNIGKILRLTGDIWQDHACCVVFIHEEDLTQRREWTQKVVNAIVKSQQWSKNNRPELAYLLSLDGSKYLPYSLPVLERVLTYYDNDFYYRNQAIIHPEWRSQRIDFQPYPFPSYTSQLVRELQQTLIEDQLDFFTHLNPEEVAQDLVDDSFVIQALAQVGGPQAFGLSLDLLRQESILL